MTACPTIAAAMTSAAQIRRSRGASAHAAAAIRRARASDPASRTLASIFRASAPAIATARLPDSTRAAPSSGKESGAVRVTV
jgi:hypothetical protein